MSTLLISLAVLGACSQNDGDLEQRLKLAGSTTVEPAALDGAVAFEANNPSVSITVRGGGSSIGVRGVGYGALHLGMTSRSLKDKEVDRWPTLVPTVVGRDGVAIVVGHDVAEAVPKLTSEQVAGMWRGSLTNWSEVGGPDLPIVVFDKEMGRGTRDVFAKAILGSTDAEAPGMAGIVGENEEVLAAIAENPGAVSILSTGWQSTEVVGLSIDAGGGAIPPSPENVASGKYPITRNLNLVTDGEPDGLAASFIAYMLSPPGQKHLADHGYTPISL